MSPRYQALAMMALAVLTISLGGCIDDFTGPSGRFPPPAKTIEVTIITAGEDIDPDGYEWRSIRATQGEGRASGG